MGMNQGNSRGGFKSNGAVDDREKGRTAGEDKESRKDSRVRRATYGSPQEAPTTPH
jgi:hypothetical protein